MTESALVDACASRAPFRSRHVRPGAPVRDGSVARKRTVLFALASAALVVRPGPAPAQEPVFPLEGLIVTASPTARPASAVAAHVTVLEGEELRERGHLDLADALRAVAGVSIVRSGSFGAATALFMRGAESDHVQVLIDGVPVNQPGGSFDFAGLTLEQVERIEVVRGPMSALYGSDAVAGVIHVITRTGSGPVRARADVRTGSYGRFDGTVGFEGGTPAAGYALSLARYRADGILPFNNEHRNTVLNGTVRLRPDEVTRAELFVRVSDRVYHFPTDGSGAIVDRNQFTFTDETSAGLSAQRWLGGRVRVAARVSVHETDGGTDDRPDDPADTLGFYGFVGLDHVRRASAEVETGFTWGEAVATAGFELERQRQRSFTESLSSFGASTDRSDYERDNRAIWFHVTRDEAPVAVHAGVRMEDNERYGTSATWQAGASWQPLAGTRLRAAAGRGIKEPTFFEAFATGFARGNPDLQPERSQSVEGGLDQDLGPRVRARVTLFRQTFRDLIQYTPTPPSEGGPNYFNVAAARASGLELGLTGDLGPLSAEAAWTWLDSEVIEGGFEAGEGGAFEAGRPLLRRPEHSLGLDLAWRAERWSVGADLDVVAAREDRDFSSFPATRVRLPAYATLGARARFTLRSGSGGTPSAELTLEGHNLLDASYEEIVGFRAAGRAVYAGVRLTFGAAR